MGISRMTQILTIEDQTTNNLISILELGDITEALYHQIKYDYNTSPWVERKYREPITKVTWIFGDSNPPPPPQSINIILLNEISEEGDLGFHEDINGGKIPVAYVGVKECKEDGVSISEVVSHEALETLVDPFVEKNEAKTIQSSNGKEYIMEVCDAVQGCGYRTKNGQMVADFVWPKWFGMAQTRTRLSQRFSVSKPFTLAPEGYISTRPIGGDESSWQQEFGFKRKSLPPWASRLPRIHG